MASKDQIHLREGMRRVVDYLDCHEISYDKTRLSSYIEFTKRHGDKENPYQYQEFVRLTREVYETVWTLDFFAENNILPPREKIERALKGHSIEKNEPEKSGARNHMLELRASAYFIAMGYLVSTEGAGDVTAEKNKERYTIECKRVYSINQLEKRTKQAIKQIDKTVNKYPYYKKRGIVWLDISPLILKNHLQYQASTLIGCLMAARWDMLQSIDNHQNKDFLKKSHNIFAFMYQHTWPYLAGESYGMTFSSILRQGLAAKGLLPNRRHKQLFKQVLSVERGDSVAMPALPKSKKRRRK